VNALRNFGPVLKNKRLTPYVLAGVGLGVMESSLYDDPVGALGQIGGGAHYGLTDNIDPDHYSWTHNNDWYMFTGVTFTWKMFHKLQSCPAYDDYWNDKKRKRR